MAEIEPITREELLLNAIAGEGSSEIKPVTRQEHYLSAIAGETDLPVGMEPITREEIYYQKILDNGGGGGDGGGDTGLSTCTLSIENTTDSEITVSAVTIQEDPSGRIIDAGPIAVDSSASESLEIVTVDGAQIIGIDGGTTYEISGDVHLAEGATNYFVVTGDGSIEVS